MEPARGRPDPSVAETLSERPWSFDFFQAVRLLTLLEEGREQPGGPYPPAREAVRFRAHRTLSYPASTIQDLSERTGDTGPAWHMAVNFLGLTGPKGVLPWHYTETAGTGATNAFSDFLDLFHHRLISLFYRAWEKYRLPVIFERTMLRRERDRDRLTESLLDVVGLGARSLRGRLPFPDAAVLRYAGHIAQRPHNAASLGALLGDYFRLPVAVEQFHGRWFPLEHDSLCWLSGEGIHNQLGYGAVAGDAVWNQQAGFRLRVGPLTLDELLAFMPDQPAQAEMAAWTNLWADTHLDYDIQLILRRDHVPYCRLGDESPTAPRLGLLAWLKTGDFQHDPGDVVFAGVNPFQSSTSRSPS